VGIGAAEPAESTVVARALPETLRGNGFGVLGLVQAIGDKGSTVVAGLLWSLLSPAIAFGYVAAWTLLSVSPATVPAGTVSLRVRNTGTLTHRVVVLPLAQGRFPDSVSVVSTARSTSPTVMAKSRELAAPTTRDGIAPATTGWTTITLPVGRYELACNAGHYLAGTHTELDVVAQPD